MSELDSDSSRLLTYLLSRLPDIQPDNMKTYPTYKEIHTALNLESRGKTFGMSLRKQGLDSLADWAISNDTPAITGLIISAESLLPGDGFFKAYQKENDDDRYKWWVDQVRQVKQHHWSADLVAPASPATTLSDDNSLPPNSEPDDQPAPPGTEIVALERVIRDTVLSLKVKQLHGWKCQICLRSIALSDGSEYAEGHHIKPLGKPHAGPDSIGNIMCVCPNHHVELDYGAMQISIKSLRHVPGHSIDAQFVRYHNDRIYKGRK